MSAAPVRWARALPSLLKVGFAESLAYRAEFVVWILTMTLPLVMLGLWTSVASEGPFASFGRADFIAYYLGALLVRNLTGNWVVWQIDDEIRTGSLNQRLLKPIHPFVTYLATHASAIPLRAAVAIPVALILLQSRAHGLVVTDAPRVALFAAALSGSFLLSFFVLVTVGTMAFFIERSIALVEIYLGLFGLLSGYIIPLALLPGWAQHLAADLPFRYMLAFPVELLIGRLDASAAAFQLGLQWMWILIVAVVAWMSWSIGVRRYEAYGS